LSRDYVSNGKNSIESWNFFSLSSVTGTCYGVSFIMDQYKEEKEERREEKGRRAEKVKFYGDFQSPVEDDGLT
jgi:hypothetical protein